MKISRKNISIGFISALVLTSFSCQNQENEFDDYYYSTTYFGWQYPVRTLVLGESLYYDNTNDINHRFVIKASIGGMYENTQNRDVEFELDNSLVEGLYLVNGTDTIKVEVLPSNYYNAIESNHFTIPKGSFNGGVTIQLTDAFFADPLSCTKKYVLPLRILNAETDSILAGRAIESAMPSVFTPVAQKWGVDPRVSSNWDKKPQNFTIYAINYVNKYHGSYLRRGAETDESVTPNQVKGYGWENKYIEKTNFIPKLSTLALNKLLYADMLAVSKLDFRAILTVNDNNVTISSELPTSNVQVTGTGSFSTDKEAWGNKKRIAFYLDYRVTNSLDNKSYHVKDTLVFRDNGVTVDVFAPVFKQ